MALYLTYRPQTFNEMIWQDHIVNILKPKVMSTDNAHSNYLFYGPRGTGKTSTARIFAKAMNCLKAIDGNPCNTCENCIAIQAGKTLDLIEIDAASHTSVDNVREEIIEKAPYPPAHLKKKIYIIDEVHMLSRNAFNALLKIMEEPPSYLIFILATTEIQKVPETIISRCQVFTFKKIPAVDLKHHLEMICKKENFTYTDEALSSIAKISDWCARDAIKYLDQVSILGDISQEHVSSFLGVASSQLIDTFLQSFITHNMDGCFAVIDTLHTSGIDIAHFIKQCLVHIEEHFSDNVAGYTTCVELLKRVNYSLRSFPLPVILLKSEIASALLGPENRQGGGTDEPAQTTKRVVTSTKSDTPAQTTPQPLTPETPQTPSDIPTPASAPIVTSLPQDDTPKSSPVSENHIASTSVETTSPSLLMDIANHPDMKPSLKSILSGSCLLSPTDTGMTLYVFNKLHTGIIQKPEHRSLIEWIYKKLTGATDGITITTMTREEYFSQSI